MHTGCGMPRFLDYPPLRSHSITKSGRHFPSGYVSLWSSVRAVMVAWCRAAGLTGRLLGKCVAGAQE
jgi:hypothetical protein